MPRAGKHGCTFLDQIYDAAHHQNPLTSIQHTVTLAEVQCGTQIVRGSIQKNPPSSTQLGTSPMPPCRPSHLDEGAERHPIGSPIGQASLILVWIHS